MNVIFLDFDGVLNTIHYSSNEDVEKRIKILSDICKKYDCKVVIEASAKIGINEETMEVEGKWLKFIFDMFKKYNIECIGRTPEVGRKLNKFCYTPIWKEDEIRLYLFRHPEIEHYAVIDDDDLLPHNSDLNKVREHLLKTIYFSDNKEEEGLLEKHIDEIGTLLEKENEIQKFAEKKQIKGR